MKAVKEKCYYCKEVKEVKFPFELSRIYYQGKEMKQRFKCVDCLRKEVELRHDTTK